MQSVTVTAPPSKSLSHRYLIAAAMAGGLSSMHSVLESDDSARSMECLAALGARFTRLGPGRYDVQGIGAGGKTASSGGRSPAGLSPDSAFPGGAASDRPVPGSASPDGVASGSLASDGARSGGLSLGSFPDSPPLSLFAGESGTTCRLMTALAAGLGGVFRVHGAGRMHQRPIGELTDALAALGADIRFEERPGCPPFILRSRGLDASSLPGGAVTIGCGESSQYLSGLLLAAPLAAQGLNILLGGGKSLSWPYVSLTLETLERFGIDFGVEALENGEWRIANWRLIRRAEPGRLRFCVRPGLYAAGSYAVEGDYSGASYFLAAGAVGPKPVRVTGLRPDSLQADAAVLELLQAMGAEVVWEQGAVTVFPAPLRGIEADMGQCPDIVPTMAAVAAHATGRSVFYNAAHLAVKESNRLEAPATELRKAGCRVEVTADGLIIDPPVDGPKAPAEGASFSAHGDHRMAMSLALLGLAGRRGESFAVPLDNPDCVAKSFPGFWEQWRLIP